jgi:hypothetical protein
MNAPLPATHHPKIKADLLGGVVLMVDFVLARQILCTRGEFLLLIGSARWRLDGWPSRKVAAGQSRWVRVARIDTSSGCAGSWAGGRGPRAASSVTGGAS